MNFQQIKNGDTGLEARAKINTMLQDLIEGDEGIIKAWELFNALGKALGELTTKEAKDLKFLMEQISGTTHYTDRVASKIYTYIDGMNGGVGGLIPSTDYDPADFPTDRAITLIALGSGTYEHFLDVTGSPIEISALNSVTVFYRGINASYWSYKTETIDAPPIDDTPTRGNTNNLVSSDGIFRAIDETVSKEVEVLSEDTVSIKPNTLYKLGSHNNLEITFEEGNEGELNEYMFEFIAATDEVTLTVPEGVRWLESPDFIEGNIYQVSVVDNLAVIVGWEANNE